jgi:hypothetical protein
VFLPFILIFRQSKMNTRKRKREEEETIRKKKVGGLTNTEKNEKKAEEQRLSQEISHFWSEFIEKTKCDMEKETFLTFSR